MDRELMELQRKPHGTYDRFLGGCDCGPCTKVFMARVKLENSLTVQHQGAKGKTRTPHPPDWTKWTHGTRSTYVHGCRCDQCKDAQRLYQRRHRQKTNPKDVAYLAGGAS